MCFIFGMRLRRLGMQMYDRMLSTSSCKESSPALLTSSSCKIPFSVDDVADCIEITSTESENVGEHAMFGHHCVFIWYFC